MQRRSFVKNMACIGACATLMAPLSRAIASAPADADVGLRLELLESAGAAVSGMLRVRATPVALTQPEQPLRVRAWVATDAGPRAFDFASFDRVRSSQRLRFMLAPGDLIGFEVASGRVLDDCSAQAACGASLAPGRYRLWLTRAGVDVAAVDLQVDARSA